MKQIAMLLAICLIPVPLRPQEHPPTTRTSGNSQASSEVTLGERLAREYEKQAGVGSTPELDGISRYINSAGSKVASVLAIFALESFTCSLLRNNNGIEHCGRSCFGLRFSACFFVPTKVGIKCREFGLYT